MRSEQTVLITHGYGITSKTDQLKVIAKSDSFVQGNFVKFHHKIHFIRILNTDFKPQGDFQPGVFYISTQNQFCTLSRKLQVFSTLPYQYMVYSSILK